MLARRPQLTGRAAVLAVVVCAIAMSLAYPIREYVAQRRQIAQLEQEQAREQAAIKALDDRHRRLLDPGYIKKAARERLFYCDPGQKCYVVMGDDRAEDRRKSAAGTKKDVKAPWYETLWQSVEAADTGRGRKAAGAGG
ncbi:septum formation initiator family protein [Streptosporangium sp. NPDC048047]|uniref:FtsB family cell division protein n=1 Tax=Streptosporangium sp. NPDC048047 TaxID=3155748 RepID=UPI00342D939F